MKTKVSLMLKVCLVVFALLSMYSIFARVYVPRGNFSDKLAGNITYVNVTVHVLDFNGNEFQPDILNPQLIVTTFSYGNVSISKRGIDFVVNLTGYGVYNVSVKYCDVLVYNRPTNVTSGELILRVNITSITVGVYTSDSPPLPLTNYNGYFTVGNCKVSFSGEKPTVYLPFGTFDYYLIFTGLTTKIEINDKFTVTPSSSRLEKVLPVISQVTLLFKTLNGLSPLGLNATVSVLYKDKILGNLSLLSSDKLVINQPPLDTLRLEAKYGGIKILEQDIKVDAQQRNVEVVLPIYANVVVKVTSIDNEPLYSQDLSFTLVTPFNEVIQVAPSPEGTFIINYGFRQDFGRYILKIKSSILNDVFSYEFAINSQQVEIQTNFRNSYLYVAPEGASMLPANMSITVLYQGEGGPVVVKYLKTSSPVQSVNEPLGFLPSNGIFTATVEYSGYKWTYNFDRIIQGKMNLLVPVFDVQLNAQDLDGKPLYGCVANLTVGRLSYVQQISSGQALFRYIPQDSAQLKIKCQGLEVASIQLLPRQVEEGSINVTARVKTFTVKVHGWFDKALPGANVTVTVVSGGNSFVSSTVTDAAGTGVLRNIPIPLGSNIIITVSYGGFVFKKNVYEGESNIDIFLDVFLDIGFLRLGLYQTVFVTVILALSLAIGFFVFRRLSHIKTLKSMFEEAEYFEEEGEEGGLLQKFKEMFKKKKEKEEEEREEFDLFG